MSTLVPLVRTLSHGHPCYKETRKTKVLPVLGHLATLNETAVTLAKKKGEMDTERQSQCLSQVLDQDLEVKADKPRLPGMPDKAGPAAQFNLNVIQWN